MKNVYVYKAKPTRSHEVETLIIHIEAEIPNPPSWDQTAERFEVDAAYLEQSLYQALPGGTYDRLLGLMLARKATHFVVSHAA